MVRFQDLQSHSSCPCTLLCRRHPFAAAAATAADLLLATDGCQGRTAAAAARLGWRRGPSPCVCWLLLSRWCGSLRLLAQESLQARLDADRLQMLEEFRVLTQENVRHGAVVQQLDHQLVLPPRPGTRARAPARRP
jgi:hypothetical protein